MGVQLSQPGYAGSARMPHLSHISRIGNDSPDLRKDSSHVKWIGAFKRPHWSCKVPLPTSSAHGKVFVDSRGEKNFAASPFSSAVHSSPKDGQENLTESGMGTGPKAAAGIPLRCPTSRNLKVTVCRLASQGSTEVSTTRGSLAIDELEGHTCLEIGWPRLLVVVAVVLILLVVACCGWWWLDLPPS